MANFPTSVSTNNNLYIAVNGVQTTLAANILATDTSIQLTSTTGFPTVGYVTIDNAEIVLYTGISGANLTGCTRGADGTTALPHNTGVTVGATIVAAHHNLLKDEVIAIETALGTNMSNVFPATPTTGSGNVVLATSPTITSPTLVTPALGTPASGVLTNATGLPLTTGTTGVLPDSKTTATPNATPSTIVERDANSNTKVNTVIENFATTATAAGTTALTAASAPIQQFTGTTTQTVTLPDATTLATGYQITVLNRSTGAVTVNNNGGLLQQTVPATAQTTFTCTNTGSANGTWDVSTSSAAGITAYREDYVVGTALNNYTGSTTVFNLVTAYSVGGHSMVVTLDGDVQTIGATIDYQETNSTTITFNNALVTGQKVSLIFQTATSAGGTVNSGTTGQIAYYPATGPTVSGTSDPTLVPAVALGTLNIQNILDNGGFEIWQRGTSFTNPATGAYATDRWSIQNNEASGVTVTKETTMIDTELASAKVVVTSPGASKTWYFSQLMENFASFRGKTITLRVRVNTSVANAVKVGMYDGVTVSESAYHTGGGGWETLSVTATISATAAQLQLEVGMLDNGDKKAGTYYFDSGMCVFGSVTPTFVPTNPQVDLARCQRFYCRIGGSASAVWMGTGQCISSTHIRAPFRFPVTMRATPTITIQGSTGFNVTNATAGTIVSTATTSFDPNPESVLFDATVASGLVAGNAGFVEGTTTSYVEASADL